jgi:hypothetical protein
MSKEVDYADFAKKTMAILLARKMQEEFDERAVKDRGMSLPLMRFNQNYKNFYGLNQQNF